MTSEITMKIVCTKSICRKPKCSSNDEKTLWRRLINCVKSKFNTNLEFAAFSLHLKTKRLKNRTNDRLWAP